MARQTSQKRQQPSDEKNWGEPFLRRNAFPRPSLSPNRGVCLTVSRSREARCTHNGRTGGMDGWMDEADRAPCTPCTGSFSVSSEVPGIHPSNHPLAVRRERAASGGLPGYPTIRDQARRPPQLQPREAKSWGEPLLRRDVPPTPPSRDLCIGGGVRRRASNATASLEVFGRRGRGGGKPFCQKGFLPHFSFRSNVTFPQAVGWRV